jgi:uncharacterized Ntn-hydrolase superfamily protein
MSLGREGGAMTYSIVARDPETGALGVAIQTCMFAVGTIAPWARAGVGAVATQAIAEPAYGPRCLDAMERGTSAADALAEAQAEDPDVSVRQVGLVAADGTATAATGEHCIEHAGHLVGDGFAVQANMMASAEVWSAMAEAFCASTASFPRRLLDALVGGQGAGGDARGVMSAALLVADGHRGEGWSRPQLDVRVDHSDDPLGEIGRLLDVSDAFGHFNRAYVALARADSHQALDEIDAALVALPDEGNLRFLRACALLTQGDVEHGRAELKRLIASRPTWEIIIRSFAAKGRIPVPEPRSIDDLLR